MKIFAADVPPRLLSAASTLLSRVFASSAESDCRSFSTLPPNFPNLLTHPYWSTRSRLRCNSSYNERSYEIQTGDRFSGGGYGWIGSAPTLEPSCTPSFPGNAWRGSGRQRIRYRSRHEDVLHWRKRRGRRHRHHASRRRDRVLAFRHGRRVADPGAHQGGEGLRDCRCGTMPKMATADFYRNHKLKWDEIGDPPSDKGMKDWVPVSGILAALVPGMIDAALVTLKEFGTKPFSEVVEPAAELADGFPIDELRAISLEASVKYLEAWPASKKVFIPNGHVLRTGEILRQTDLARTLRSMAEVEKKALASGASRAKAIDAIRDYFYRGDIAHRIDEFSKQNGGLLRYEDMAAFHLEPEEAVSTTYHGYTVYKPGFWSQGPSMIEALNILEGFNLADLKLNSAEYIHTLTEALKLAYADRDTFYGDPKFVKIPADK